MVMAYPSPQQVGREFVRQYYTVLHEAPEFLHRFYSSASTFVHGGVDRPLGVGTTASGSGVTTSASGGHVEEPVVGQLEINKKILSLAFKDCHTKIRQVDAQATIGSGVVVQVTGELSNNGEPMRRFMQTFVLAPQTPKKFYVHNDIFRYQDEVYQDVSDCESEEVQTAATGSVQQAAANAQPLADLKAAADMVVVDSVSADLDHHHHHDHNHSSGGDASSSSSSSSSSSDQAVETTPSASAPLPPLPPTTTTTSQQQQPDHYHHRNHHQEEVVVVSKQQTTPSTTTTAQTTENVKENGPTEAAPKQSSWARIISKDGKMTEVAPSAAAVTPTVVPAVVSSYSTNSLPRNNGANKENRGSFKQNGGAGFNGNNNNNKANSSKPRNSASNSSFTGASTNNNATTTSMTNQASSQQQPVVNQQPTVVATSRQNGTTDAMIVDETVAGGQGGGGGGGGEDKRFGSASARYPDTHQVFVGNLSQELSDAELRDFFGQFGRVVEVRINTNTKQQGGRRLPNYGFVVFEEARAVEKVLSSTKSNNLTLRNERGEFRLNIEEKRARQGRQSSGLGGGGGGGVGGGKPQQQQQQQQPRSNRSTSNGSGGQLNGGGGGGGGKKPQQFNRDEQQPARQTSTTTYQRRS